MIGPEDYKDDFSVIPLLDRMDCSHTDKKSRTVKGLRFDFCPDCCTIFLKNRPSSKGHFKILEEYAGIGKQ